MHNSTEQAMSPFPTEKKSAKRIPVYDGGGNVSVTATSPTAISPFFKALFPSLAAPAPQAQTPAPAAPQNQASAQPAPRMSQIGQAPAQPVPPQGQSQPYQRQTRPGSPNREMNPLAPDNQQTYEPYYPTGYQPIPLYDRGGDVDVNDGRHQLAVLEDGERVLNPREAEAYRRTHGEKETEMSTRLPKINLYDNGGDISAAAGRQAQAEGDARLNSFLAAPSSKPYAPAPVQDTTNGNAFGLKTIREGLDKRAQDRADRVSSDRGDHVMQPSYTPGSYPEEQAPAMPKIKMYDEGGDVSSEEKSKPQLVLPEQEAERPIEQSHGVLRSDANAEQLIPEDSTERGTPQERAAIKADKQQAMGKGALGLKDLGLAAIHERHLEPSTSTETEPIAERPISGIPQITTPASSVVPSETLALIPGTPENRASKEFHQETAGGPLIPGAAGSESPAEQRDLRNMERKAKVANLEKQRQDAIASGDLTTADKLAVAKAELQKRPWNDRSGWSKFGKIASTVGNIAGDVLVPNLMAQIPGTDLNNAIKEQASFNRIPIESEVDQREAAANAKDTTTPSWKEVTGGLLNPTTGQYEQAFYNEKNPKQQVFAGQLPPKAGGEKAETREQHLNRYAELKNLQESGAQLSDQDQKEFNTLRTELTVPKATMDSYNKQIDAALHAASVPQSLWSNYHVLPGATAEEAKQSIADAKAFSGETYQQGAESRTMDKEERAQERKDKSTVVYAEDEHGQLIKTNKFDADKRNLVAEEMKAGDIAKDRSAMRQLNDVQTNVNRYEQVIATDLPKVSDKDRERMTTIMSINAETGGGLLRADAGGKFISISGAAPQWSAQITSRKYDLAKEELEALSPEAKRVMNAYLRTAASVPTYLKAIAGIGRSNKETLELELANVPMPYYDLETARGRMEAFQDNVDQAKSGFPNNLPGMKLIESERSKGQKTTHPTETSGIPKGATGIAPGNDGNKYYHDAQGNILGKVK